jgi:hypothetical protein
MPSELINDIAGIPSKPRFIVTHMKELLQPLPPIRWVVEPIFTESSLNLVVGPYGCKKTYAMMDFAVKVALGSMWIDYKATQGKVLFIDEENGNDIIHRRFQECSRGSFGDENTPVDCYIIQRLNLTDEKEAILLEAAVSEGEYKVVIIDSLVDVMPGADENLVKDAVPVLKRLRMIAENTHACIIVLHHANWTGRTRGSTSIPGEVDVLINVKSSENTNHVEFFVEKTRRTKSFKFTAYANWSDSGQFWLGPAEEKGPEKHYTNGQKYVLKILTERGPMSLQEIEDNVDSCSPRAARDGVYALARDGEVYRTNPGDGGKGVKAIYAICQHEDK